MRGQARRLAQSCLKRLHQLWEIKLREDVAAARYPFSDTGPVKLYSGLMLAACRPLGPCFVSKLTFWFSASVLKPSPLISEKGANRSSTPLSGVMKPKPLLSL